MITISRRPRRRRSASAFARALLTTPIVAGLLTLRAPTALGQQGSPPAPPAPHADHLTHSSPASPAAAADTARPTLAAIYAEARRASPRIAAAQAIAAAARARVPGVKRPPDPELQLGFMNYSLPSLTPMEPLGMTQLQLMQMVPTAGKLRFAGKAASARAGAEGERAEEVAWMVRSEAAMAFYEVWAADEKLAVDRETLRLLQDIRQVAEAMYRVGEGRQSDVLRASVEIARMAEDTVRMATMRTGMAAKLNAVLDRPATSAVPTPAFPTLPDALPPLATLVEGAMQSRPMIRAGLREVDAASAQLALARREIWPDLTVGVQLGQSRVTMPGATLPDGEVMPAERTTERMGSLMIGATLPIFAKSRQLRMREEMTAMQRMATADVAAMRAETRGRVIEAYATLERARNLQRLYRTTILPQAEATVQSSLAAYRVGQVNFMTLLDNRMAVNTYRQELIGLRADEGKAWAELEMLVGQALIDSRTPTDTSAPTAAPGGIR